jgi:hypothetical protein
LRLAGFVHFLHFLHFLQKQGVWGDPSRIFFCWWKGNRVR